MTKNWFSVFKTAWALFTHIPLPAAADEKPADSRQAVPALPLVGLVIGLILWLLAWLFTALLGSRIVAAVLCGIILPAFYGWVTGFRTVRSTVDVIIGWRSGPSGRAGSSAAYAPLIGLQTLLILSALGVALLVALGSAAWLVLVPTLAATVLAEELHGGAGGNSRSSGRYLHWALAAVVAVVAAGFMGLLIPGLFAVVLAWLLNPILQRWFAVRSDADAQSGMWAATALIELLVVWLGVVAS